MGVRGFNKLLHVESVPVNSGTVADVWLQVWKTLHTDPPSSAELMQLKWCIALRLHLFFLFYTQFRHLVASLQPLESQIKISGGRRINGHIHREIPGSTCGPAEDWYSALTSPMFLVVGLQREMIRVHWLLSYTKWPSCASKLSTIICSGVLKPGTYSSGRPFHVCVLLSNTYQTTCAAT